MADGPDASIAFDDFRTVRLEPGDYVLRVEQTVQAVDVRGSAAPITEPFRAERNFTVAGPRFALEPGDVRAVYPADGADGDFSRVLPHVVISRPALPWTRSARFDQKITPDAEAPVPWLALVLVNEADGSGLRQSKDGSGPFRTATVTNHGGKIAIATGDESDEESHFPELPAESCDPETGQVQIVDMARDLARRIIPGRDALCLQSVVVRDGTGVIGAAEVDPDEFPSGAVLAGADYDREVNLLLDRDAEFPRAADAPTADEYAVLICNRPPLSGRATLLLLSLEGRTGPDGKTDAFTTEKSFVRYVCLGHWRFHDHPNAKSGMAGMAEMARNVSVGFLRTGTADHHPKAGSASLLHRRRTGGTGTAWRRGPLVATPIALTEAITPLSARRADDLVLIDPAGEEPPDVSYASAWEIGRLKALAAPEVARSLAYWWRCCLHAHCHADRSGRLVDLPCEAPAAGPGFPGDWFDRLIALETLPFAQFVPDAGHLPRESLRLFLIDPLWVEALFAGALAVGRPLSEANPQHQEITDRLNTIRAARRTGFLLRSDIVSTWRELSISALVGGQPVEPTLSRPSKGILMGVLDGYAQAITLQTPPDLPHFEVPPEDLGETRSALWAANRLRSRHEITFRLT